MAQAFAPYSQDRGTLSPGQTILVNNYTIQVEKYLNQGGFAHVYLVRTATPVNNTTQHVLKRIAVSDEAMLVEVRKEVDIMRLLRGHPNIVNFIDASWQALPNGTYEVFILMEFCNGGGIIDMMNRRLRERLTEAEILQIFVDVCEAVAAMHNLKPALLHRDLKVENILQSSLTRYKLCDFGSSTPVLLRPPSSMHEIRLLEADLNKHTTLQYRAPEMVDVHLRRPVDEKSDVWALGVLLYKLCYYTTPFEEHGPLAILNVQYKIPPYPVYSPQINALIASMLRELGTQRPSVFEVLSLVHRMRGSKSPYRYNIPPPQSLRPSLQESSGIESLVSFRTSPTPNTNTSTAAQARQTILDAIAPMRRGRPTTSTSSSSSVTPEQEKKDLEIRKFEEKWKSIQTVNANRVSDDVWDVSNDKAKTNTMAGWDGFGDSFVDSSVGLAAPASSIVSAKPSGSRLGVQKDAFDGLGGISHPHSPSPTLAEATKHTQSKFKGSLPPPRINGISRTPLPIPPSTPLSPRIPASRTGLATYHPPASLSAEERYPSLDELDKDWLPRTTSQIHPTSSAKYLGVESKPAHSQSRTEGSRLSPSGARPSEFKNVSIPLRGEARSQQVTGTAMRGEETGTAPLRQVFKPSTSNTEHAEKQQLPIGSSPTKYRPSRPALARKHRSFLSTKSPDPRPAPQDWLTGDDPVPVESPSRSPPSPLKRRSSPMFSSSPSKGSSDASGLTHPLTQDKDRRSPNAQQAYGQKRNPSPTTANSHIEFAGFKRPTMHAQRHPDEASRRQDSSSDDLEGPEDVDGRVMKSDGKKRRQSSVHDLVDLYGGGVKSPLDREPTSLPSPGLGRKGRRTSGNPIDASLPSSASSAPSLLSPTSIVPESRAELASRSSASSSQGGRMSPSAHLTESSEPSPRSANRSSPAGSPMVERSNKPRPQSMFMLSPKPSMDSSSDLRVPDGPRQRASPRRGSISDMVDLYETLGGGVKPKDSPANKPVGLKLSKTSPIASRFPPISPSGVSFPLGQVTGLLAEQTKPKLRRSPTTTSSGDYINSLGSPTKPKGDFISRVPRRQSVSPNKWAAEPMPIPAAPSKPLKPASLSMPRTADLLPTSSSPRTLVMETPISSPSPERPYQGVGPLIDQWQRKTEEADASRRSGPRTPGRAIGLRASHGRREDGNGE